MARTQADRTRETRSALVARAAALFAERGYADTSTELILEGTGVTRGALYHHFRDKRALFFEVCRDLHERIAEESRPPDRGALPVRYRQSLVAAAARASRPDAYRILAVDAFSVLSLEENLALDREYGQGRILAALRADVDRGAALVRAPEACAALLAGALNGAIIYLAGAGSTRKSLREIEQAFDALLAGVFQAPLKGRD